MSLSYSISGPLSFGSGKAIASPDQGVGVTILRREADGTVTVVSLARVWTPTLTRLGDGTVQVA